MTSHVQNSIIIFFFPYRIFLFRHGGNPNKKNSRNETALHNVCITGNGRNVMVQQRRTDCLLLMLQWTGDARMENGEVEKVDLGATDEVW